MTPGGKVDCLIDGELADSTGRVAAQLPVRPVSGQPWMGGKGFVQCLSTPIPQNAAPGTYQLRVRARDARGTERSASLTFFVQAGTTFGAANIRLFHDAEHASPAGGVFSAGAEATIAFSIVGCSAEAGRVDVESRLSAVDEDGKVVSVQPIETTLDRRVKDAAERSALGNGLPCEFRVGLNRPGKFRFRIELKDNAGKRSAVHEVPFVVVPSP